jgi:hypothetical protein
MSRQHQFNRGTAVSTEQSDGRTNLTALVEFRELLLIVQKHIWIENIGEWQCTEACWLKLTAWG